MVATAGLSFVRAAETAGPCNHRRNSAFSMSEITRTATVNRQVVVKDVSPASQWDCVSNGDETHRAIPLHKVRGYLTDRGGREGAATEFRR
ncbi:hypothetical protein MPPM_3671 [Methylorubrum populi]|uniref:Uncharacterized protein n=1 Tax=Methylorubrum populi TaxID=223967 RepID=A0A160PHG0_9HYPH|nr:hypothetical protein MPPM_3671 [Methylorubrum populi]